MKRWMDIIWHPSLGLGIPLWVAIIDVRKFLAEIIVFHMMAHHWGLHISPAIDSYHSKLPKHNLKGLVTWTDCESGDWAKWPYHFMAVINQRFTSTSSYALITAGVCHQWMECSCHISLIKLIYGTYYYGSIYHGMGQECMLEMATISLASE